MTFIIEGQDPGALTSGVRSVAASVAPTIPIENLQRFTEAMQRAESSDYVIIATLGGFAMVALLLATTGLFGVVSYSVSQRTPEFGTRMALGAPASAVVGLVARQSGRLLAIGLAVGLAGGVAVGFAMRGMLYGTSPADPATLAGVAVSARHRLVDRDGDARVARVAHRSGDCAAFGMSAIDDSRLVLSSDCSAISIRDSVIVNAQQSRSVIPRSSMRHIPLRCPGGAFVMLILAG